MIVTATGTTVPTPTHQFRRTPTGRLYATDESGQLMPGFHWQHHAKGRGGYNVVQNAVGECWTVDDTGLMYFFGGISPIKSAD